jgi:hypothetical protein
MTRNQRETTNECTVLNKMLYVQVLCIWLSLKKLDSATVKVVYMWKKRALLLGIKKYPMS